MFIQKRNSAVWRLCDRNVAYIMYYNKYAHCCCCLSRTLNIVTPVRHFWYYYESAPRAVFCGITTKYKYLVLPVYRCGIKTVVLLMRYKMVHTMHTRTYQVQLPRVTRRLPRRLGFPAAAEISVTSAPTHPIALFYSSSSSTTTIATTTSSASLGVCVTCLCAYFINRCSGGGGGGGVGRRRIPILLQ